MQNEHVRWGCAADAVHAANGSWIGTKCGCTCPNRIFWLRDVSERRDECPERSARASHGGCALSVHHLYESRADGVALKPARSSVGWPVCDCRRPGPRRSAQGEIDPRVARHQRSRGAAAIMSISTRGDCPAGPNGCTEVVTTPCRCRDRPQGPVPRRGLPPCPPCRTPARLPGPVSRSPALRAQRPARPLPQ